MLFFHHLNQWIYKINNLSQFTDKQINNLLGNGITNLDQNSFIPFEERETFIREHYIKYELTKEIVQRLQATGLEVTVLEDEYMPLFLVSSPTKEIILTSDNPLKLTDELLKSLCGMQSYKNITAGFFGCYNTDALRDIHNGYFLTTHKHPNIELKHCGSNLYIPTSKEEKILINGIKYIDIETKKEIHDIKNPFIRESNFFLQALSSMFETPQFLSNTQNMDIKFIRGQLKELGYFKAKVIHRQVILNKNREAVILYYIYLGTKSFISKYNIISSSMSAGEKLAAQQLIMQHASFHKTNTKKHIAEILKQTSFFCHKFKIIHRENYEADVYLERYSDSEWLLNIFWRNWRIDSKYLYKMAADTGNIIGAPFSEKGCSALNNLANKYNINRVNISHNNQNGRTMTIDAGEKPEVFDWKGEKFRGNTKSIIYNIVNLRFGAINRKPQSVFLTPGITIMFPFQLKTLAVILKANYERLLFSGWNLNADMDVPFNAVQLLQLENWRTICNPKISATLHKKWKHLHSFTGKISGDLLYNLTEEYQRLQKRDQSKSGGTKNKLVPKSVNQYEQRFTTKLEYNYMIEDYEHLKQGCDMQFIYYNNLHSPFLGCKFEFGWQRVLRVLQDTTILSWTNSISLKPQCELALSSSEYTPMFQDNGANLIGNISLFRFAHIREFGNIAWLIGVPIISFIVGFVANFYVGQFYQQFDANHNMFIGSYQKIGGGIGFIIGLEILGQVHIVFQFGIGPDGLWYSIVTIENLNKYGTQMLNMNM